LFGFRLNETGSHASRAWAGRSTAGELPSHALWPTSSTTAVRQGKPRTHNRECGTQPAHQSLITDLLRTRLHPPIAEGELADTFGVSRTPLREALKALSSESLVDLRPRRTPIVAPVDPSEIGAIFEVLESLEALAGRRASENASDRDIADLERMHAAMVAEHDADWLAAYAARNRDIHARIVELAGNPC
jgi:DNA-binding GntR family transcriptional regulator